VYGRGILLFIGKTIMDIVLLIDKINLTRDQTRLIEMATHAVDDLDQRNAMLQGCFHLLESIDDMLSLLREAKAVPWSLF
jgi:hypothetical protein